jgi:hypothetical protein
MNGTKTEIIPGQVGKLKVDLAEQVVGAFFI